jgi:hypothetical protein
VCQESYSFDSRRWYHCGIHGSSFSNHISVLNQVKGASLEEIRIVQQFLDVFPKELLGMSPRRDIEFLIELLPGIPPIMKRPYRMLMNELVELKKQLAELQAKGFIHPSSSS